MPGEKTEQPTQKRLNDSRKKGEVFKSKDFAQALLFMVAAAVLIAGGPAYVAELRGLDERVLHPGSDAGNMPGQRHPEPHGICLVQVHDPFGTAARRSRHHRCAANFLQVKALFAPEVIKPKFEKLNPLNGFKNTFFSSKSYIELAKTLLKFFVVFWLVYATIKASMRDIIPTPGLRLDQTAGLAAHLMTGILLKVGVVFVLLGAADFLIQKKMFMKKMMMSKEDIKQEYKEQEGDPHVKHMRKHLFQQMMNESIARNVPRATVIVANPTHLAIALRYDEATMQAPKVTAKGQNVMALKILDIAKQHQVPVVRNIGLAHSLYDLEIGLEVPEDLYEAVAEVLNFVSQLAAVEG